MFGFDFLYWYKLIFLTELLVSEACFVRKLKRRNRFLLRLIGSLTLLYAVVFFFPMVSYDVFYMSFLFLAVFMLTLSAMFFCFKESFWNVLFCGIAAYTIQHIAYIIYTLLVNLFGISPIPLYESENADFYSSIGGWTVFIYFVSYFITYWSAFFLLSNKMNLDGQVKPDNFGYVVLAGLIVLIDIILNMVTEYNKEGNLVSCYLEWFYNLLTCVLALAIQFGMLSRKKMETDLDVVNRLLKTEEKQYKSIKANVDAINIKVHDLKHYIGALKAGDKSIGAEELTEMENLVSFYETIAKTGNDTLDVILTEKLYYCMKHSIKMTYIVDGKLLDFMKATDIYALFGNALDNAIESVLKLEKNKRNIGFFVKQRGNMVTFHMENYFDGDLELRDGLPVTKKENTFSHGFGMLSMKVIAEKYNGTLSVELLNDVFNLNIVFLQKL